MRPFMNSLSPSELVGEELEMKSFDHKMNR